MVEGKTTHIGKVRHLLEGNHVDVKLVLELGDEILSIAVRRRKEESIKKFWSRARTEF